jgi:hypothetical protein
MVVLKELEVNWEKAKESIVKDEKGRHSIKLI